MEPHRPYRERRYAFGEQLLSLRTRIALTQIELAEQIGVHRRSVQNWETGESYPKAETLRRLIGILLDHHAFTAGQERTEAQALWNQAAQDGPHALPFFDEVWFVRTLALRAGDADQGLGIGKAETQPPAPSPQPPISSPQSPIIDWGEAIAVPTLYGRERELQTLRNWVVEDNCRMIAILGLGGIGKSSLAVTIAHQVADQFEVVLFRSLQNGPPLAQLLDQTIRSLSEQHTTPPDRVPDKITLLVQLFRERRCLLILDNFESLLQPGVLVGTYRTGYAEYAELLQSLSTRAHQSCVLVTSREKLAELAPLAGRTAPVRILPLLGLSDSVCQTILETKDISGTATEVQALTHLYGGNPLALMLAAEPIRELFGGDIGTFLAAGSSFFNGVGKLLEQQVARSTPLEQTLLYTLAIERELVPINVLLAKMSSTVLQRDTLVALESLRRRLLIEQAVDQPALRLQPVILEFLTDQLVEAVYQEIVTEQPRLLLSHACIQATAKDYVRRSQEQLIAAPLLERLAGTVGRAEMVERQLLKVLAPWRDQPLVEQGYGPGNIINLLRLLRGNLRSVDLAQLAIRQAFLQGVDMQDSSLTGALLQDTVVSEAFDALLAVAVSGTGEYWAAASRRGEIRVWAAGGQTLHRVWRAHTDMVWALALSPDGNTLASGSWDSTVKLWDVASGRLCWLGHHTSRINRIVFSPDGRLLASSGNDATVRFWDPQSGDLLHTLPHPEAVIAICWSRDGRMFASGDAASVIRLWELQAIGPPICVRTLQAHTVWVNGLVFDPDGRTLVSVSWDTSIRLWDVASGRLRATLTGHTDQVLRVDWSSDGRVLASSSRDQTLRLWDVERGEYRAVLHGHSGGVDGLVFAPDSRTLISGSEDGTLRVWDVAHGECMRVLQGYAPVPYVVDWSPDSKQLISGGTDWLVTIWDTTEQARPRILSGHSGVVCGVGWSSDGQYVASSQWDNAIRLWESASGACLRVLRHPDDSGNCFYDLAWSPDGRRLASGTNRHGVQVFERIAQRHQWDGREFPTVIRHVAWNPTGVYLAGAGDDGIVYVWSPDEDTPAQRLAGHQGAVRSLAWSPDGRWLASGGGSERGELFVWDLQRGERVGSVVDETGMIFAVAWGARDALVVSGGGDGTLRCWDVQRGQAVWASQAHQGSVQSLRRSPDGARLASCGDDGAIMIWDVQSGAHHATLRHDRPYERMDITGLTGITAAQRASLIALGAVEVVADQRAATRAGDQKVALGLPAQSTAFIGRNAELAAIARLLADPQCRLLTLIGPGGIGKTRLALAVAASQASAFADGVAFVALSAVSTPNQIIAAIGAAIGLAFAAQPDPTAHLLGALQQRQMLLILDSFEHLLDPGLSRDEGGADLVAAILGHAPQINILVTSRERLDLQTEWLFDVEGLAFPPAESPDSAAPSQKTLADYSALQLFRQRAMQVQPGLLLDEAMSTTIIRICRHVAGMPLAIELAAAAVRLVPIAEIERQLGAHLDVLATTLRDVPARHRSMRVAFDHSWRLLSEAERALFSHVAVFRGGWTLAAAAAVQSAEFNVKRSEPNAAERLPQNSELRTLMAALVDKSLVRWDSATARSTARRAASDAMVAPRYTMLEPIREYALGQLAARGEAAALQHAHATYYLTLAEAAVAQWDSPAADTAIAQLDHEYDNLRAVLQWARDGGDRTIGLRLAAALRRFWQRRGYYSEGRAWLEDLLALDDAPADTAIMTMAVRQRALHAAAWLVSDQHDFARAAQLFAQSSALRRTLGEREGETQALLTTARQARAAGQYQRATALFEAALERHRAMGNRESASAGGLGQALYDLALVRREQGDVAGAIGLLEEGLDLHRMIGEREGIVIGLLGLGDIARDQGNVAGVREYAGQSLVIARELGIQWAIGFALNNLALADYVDGNLTHARALVDESVALFRRLKADGSLAEVLITKGQIMQAQGDATAAYAALSEALRFALTVGPRLMVPYAVERLADVVAEHGQTQLGVQWLAAASALREQMGTPVRSVDQMRLTNTLTTARSALGNNTVAAVWVAAQTLPLEQVLSSIISAATFDDRGAAVY